MQYIGLIEIMIQTHQLLQDWKNLNTDYILDDMKEFMLFNVITALWLYFFKCSFDIFKTKCMVSGTFFRKSCWEEAMGRGRGETRLATCIDKC